MQTINLDLSVRSIIPLLHAKQGDVGRKFKVVLTDNLVAYPVPMGAAVSVWYSGPSGQGNYTDIGADSAVSVSGNEITVELITQMLANAGEGRVCLAINTADGDQISTWNIPYVVEPLPGLGSEAAKDYFTAFSQAVENLPYPDSTLSAPGKAADAAAVGAALAGKAPAGYGLGESGGAYVENINIARNGWYRITPTTVGGNGAYSLVRVDAFDDTNVHQTAYSGLATSAGFIVQKRVCFKGSWSEWEYENPHMVPGYEYRTTERWNGLPVYVKMINFGALPNASVKNVEHGISRKAYNVRCDISSVDTGNMLSQNANITTVIADSTIVQIATSSDMSDINAFVTLWYVVGS